MDRMLAFRQSLAEAIAWCAPRASTSDPENNLRSPLLRPDSVDLDGGFSERQACVAGVVEERARLLRAEGRAPESLANDLAGGRLLLFAPDETLSDGAAYYGSRGFFDSGNTGNVPPWDAWVLYVEDEPSTWEASEDGIAWRRGRWSYEPPLAPTPFTDFYVLYPMPHRTSYLVSWVPPELIPLAQAGIVVNPESCIEWLADRETPFTVALQAAGLLL